MAQAHLPRDRQFTQVQTSNNVRWMRHLFMQKLMFPGHTYVRIPLNFSTQRLVPSVKICLLRQIAERATRSVSFSSLFHLYSCLFISPHFYPHLLSSPFHFPYFIRAHSFPRNFYCLPISTYISPKHLFLPSQPLISIAVLLSPFHLPQFHLSLSTSPLISSPTPSSPLTSIHHKASCINHHPSSPHTCMMIPSYPPQTTLFPKFLLPKTTSFDM